MYIGKGETMGKLTDMVGEYKKNPSVSLKNRIFDYILTLDNLDAFDQTESESAEGVINAEWIEFDNNIRLKKAGEQRYIVTEVFGIPNRGFICYCFRIDLSDYTASEIASYAENCQQYESQAPDKEVFSAFAVAMAYNPKESVDPFLANDESALKAWYKRIDEEVML